MTDLEGLPRAPGGSGAEFILAGGVAAPTPLAPCLGGAPPGLPLQRDAATLHRGLNLTLTSALGETDPLGATCRCLNLEWLIRVKRAAGRPRDPEAIADPEALLEERKGSGQ